MDNKWVIVFLIYADFRVKDSFSMSHEMKIEINEMFKNILDTPIYKSNARVYVILNGIRYFFKDPQTGEIRIETITILYEILRSKKSKTNKFGKCQIIDSSVLSNNQPLPTTLQSAVKLKLILDLIKVKRNEEVFFVTWDHGSAFGIFRSTSPSPPSIRLPIDDPNELDKFPYLKLFWNKALKLKGFKDLLKTRLSEKSIDLSYHVIEFEHNLFRYPNVNSGFIDQFIRVSNLPNVQFRRFGISGTEKSVLVADGFNGDRAYVPVFSDKIHDYKGAIDTSVFKIELQKTDVPDILKNEELAEALSGWLNGRKVGVLLMMNCWMMNLHTMYSMQNAVQCLVAPQGDIANPGYNYEMILKKLYSKGDFISPVKLADICVKTTDNASAIKRARKLNIANPNTIDTWKIIAINLQKRKDGSALFQRQLQSLKELVDLLIVSAKNDNEFKSLLKYVRTVCYDFTNKKSMMVDILNWVLSIKFADEDLHIKFPIVPLPVLLAIGKLNKSINDASNGSIVIAKSKAPSIYLSPDPSNPVSVIGLEPTGYSIFFPQYNIDGGQFDNLRDNLKTDLFLIEFLKNWKDFLKTVIDEKIEF